MTGDDARVGRRDLSEAKRRLLEAKLAHAVSNSRPQRRIPIAPDTTRFPATSPQNRFWFLNVLDPDDPAYNMHVVLDLRGRLDDTRLESALRAVCERHAVLGGHFVSADGRLWMAHDNAAPISLHRHRLDSRDGIEAFLVDLVRQPFQLTHGPLLRAHLVELDAAHHSLLIVVHHIVCDEPSLDILLRDLGRYYDGATPDSAEAVRFRDYALWHDQGLASVLAEQLPYWTRSLDALETRTGLEADRTRVVPSERRGKILRTSLPRKAVSDARSLAASENATLFPLMAAVWFLLLDRYSGNHDIAVGTPASLRTLPELQGTVGLFLNTLVLRAKLEPDWTFRQTLCALRDVSLGAFSHQDIPLEAVVDALNPQRTAGENPFFDTMIVQESEPGPVPGFRGLDVERRFLDAGVCKFDLTLFFRDTGDGLLLSVEYDTALYSSARIEALLDHFAALLKNGLAMPDTPVGRLPYLREEDTDWLERRSAGPWQQVEDSPLVAEQIFANLRSLGEQTAIVDETGPCSYRELNALVDNVVGRICRVRQAPRYVALLLDRDRWAIGAMLSAWRLGAGYAPLDPGYPPDRLAASLEALQGDAPGGVLVVTTRAHAKLLPDGVDVVTVDEPQESGSMPDHADKHIAPQDLAYIVFTSGSTGTPKGVRISHENLRVSTVARRQVYGAPPERFLLLSSLAFDSSVAGLFWTLLDGGTLVVPPADRARDAREIARLIERHRITHTLMLPTLYALVLRSCGGQALDSLDTVSVAGEACPASLFPAHVAVVPNARLFNEYGPSEATVWSTAQELDGSDDDVPIGVPVPSVRAFVLDAMRQPLPPGHAGELCVAGPTLSPGYLDAAQDRDAFVEADLFGERRRLYCTGDRVRFDSKGRLLFLGRIDEQVKVRGHRVELEDINAAISRFPDVLEAATAFDELHQTLQGFVVSASENLSVEALAAHLRSELPEFMIPARLAQVSDLPRLPNGKLDMSRLTAEPAASGEPVELDRLDMPDFLRLKELWCKSLGLDDCDPRANFFDLGGHSLKALQLLLDIEDVFGTRLSLPALYSKATLSELHALLHDYDSHDDGEILYPAKLSGSEAPLFIALAPLEQLLGKIDAELPLLGMYHGINPPPGPEVSVEIMAGRYLDAMRRHQPHGPYRLAGYSFGCTLVLEIAHQCLQLGETIERVILLDPPPPVPEGDLRFRVNRVLDRIRSAGSSTRQAAFALNEARRIGKRVLLSVRRRLHRSVSEASGRVPSRGALIQAGVDWSRLAARNYEYKPCPFPVLFVMPERPEVSVAGQLRRWDGLLTGRVDVLTVEGPEHQDLLAEPWVSEIGAAINEALVTRRRDLAGAA